MVGTFNLGWAFDATDDRTEMANENNAATPADWEWKRNEIAKVLAREQLDVVALQGIGGERELIDLVVQLREASKLEYEYAFVDGEDRITGLQVALLSKYPLQEKRRLDISLPRHVAADVKLPDDRTVTMLVVHLRAGSYRAQIEARMKQAKSLKRAVDQLRKDQPVVVLGDVNGELAPEQEGYKATAEGLLSGAATPSKLEDDCKDSAYYEAAQMTDWQGKATHRIFVCGLDLRSAAASSRNLIFRGDVDPEGSKWSKLPVDHEPFRDVSENLLVRAQIVLPDNPTSAAGE